MRRIYLDWNATAPLLPEVQAAMVEAMSMIGNASSIHQEGQRARSVVEKTRRSVAKAVDAAAQGIFFTGGATESNNQIIRGFLTRNPNAQILCSAVEHPSVLEVIKDLGAACPTAILRVDTEGRLLAGWHDQIDRSRPFLVSVMWANNEIGNLYPIAELAQEVHALGGFLHVDATQALGRVPFSFQASGADFMSLSFHKMGGPKGVGAVVVREGLKVDAMVSGGHQERGRRPGTENVLGLAGLDAAMRSLVEHADEWHASLLRKRQVFLDALLTIDGVQLRGEQHFVLPNTINAAFQNVDGEDLLLALDLAGLACSSGSACTAGSLEPSHVILAMGFAEDEARRSVRFSFGPSVDDEDLLDAAHRIAVAVDQLRKI